MSRRSLLAIVTLTVLIGAGGAFSSWYFGWFHNEPEVEPERGVGPRVMGPEESYSNILPADYVGPGKCAECHQEQHQLWSKHPHRFMNQLASKAAIKGNFADHVWTVRPGYTVTFSTEGNDFLMTVDRPTRERTRYKVTRTVGSRFVQYYIGVQTVGTEPPGDRVYTTEHRLPFAYWFRMNRWLPIDYFDVGDDSPEVISDGYLVVDGVDAKPRYLAYLDSCVHCHNTYPHAYRIFRKTLRGFPGAVMEPDMKPLAAALADKFSVDLNRDAFEGLPYRIDPNKDLVTVGISCESCHMGGREHAINAKPVSFYPTSPHVHVTSRTEDKPFTGKRKNPATSQGICAQCHSASQVSEHPNGARIRNSAEARDMLDGACATQIRCVSCHDPHTAGVPSGGPTLPKYLDACVKCHPKYSTPEAGAAHSRHPAKSGVDCLDCHMPRITQGIDDMSRTHRISQPVEQSMISKGAPNACNVCHLDKSMRWTLSELKKGWGRDIQPLDGAPKEALEEPAGKVWLKSSQSIERMIAVDSYAKAPLWKPSLDDVLPALNDLNSTNRSLAVFSVERVLGRRLSVSEFDILGAPAQRSKQLEALRTALKKKQ